MAGEIKTAHNLPRDILRGILGPMFGGVERDNPDRVAVLAEHQVVDGGFEIGLSDIGFRECGAQLAEIVDDKINRLIVAVRYNRRGPAPTHGQLPTTRHREVKHETGAVEPQSI